MIISVAQINTVIGDFENNIKKIREATDKASGDLVVFPELCLCGYPVMDLASNESFVEENEKALRELAREIPNDKAIIVGFVQKNPNGKPYNAAAFIHNKKVEFVQHKMLLPTYDVFDETRIFSSAKSQEIFYYKKTFIGLSICEDLWNNSSYLCERHLRPSYDIDPVTTLVRKGAELIVNISASPFVVDKWKDRKLLLQKVAQEHEVPVVYANAVGGNDSLVFDGHSLCLDSNGRLSAEGACFKEGITYYDTVQGVGEINYSDLSTTAQIHDAIVLGIRDYVRKTGFERVVIGLSGGIDSAVVAALATDALGAENVTGVMMPSKFSSQGSVSDSMKLAENLGINCFTVEIEVIKQQYLKQLILSPLADENLQARIRGNILMAHSNSAPKTMVLTTGNKSELSVGYCTIYGDMAGGFAPISDLYKTQVLDLAYYINRHKKAIPQSILTKEPSAELSDGQKDTDSLPPYSVLDDILYEYIEKRSDIERVAMVTNSNIGLVSRIVKMVDANEYKRRQAAPGIKVNSLAFGDGRKLPIARKITETKYEEK